MKTKLRDNLGFNCGLVLFLFAVFMFWQSFTYQYYTAFGPGPGLLPRWLNGLLIILSIFYMASSMKKEIISISEVMPKGDILKKILWYPAVTLLFVLIIPYVGFNIAGTIMLFILFRQDYKWYQALGISVLVTIILFIMFKMFLMVPLPVNALGW